MRPRIGRLGFEPRVEFFDTQKRVRVAKSLTLVEEQCGPCHYPNDALWTCIVIFNGGGCKHTDVGVGGMYSLSIMVLLILAEQDLVIHTGWLN